MGGEGFNYRFRAEGKHSLHEQSHILYLYIVPACLMHIFYNLAFYRVKHFQHRLKFKRVAKETKGGRMRVWNRCKDRIRGREVYGDKQYPVMVYIVSVVPEHGSLMHCTAGPKTIVRMRTAWRICISITCGCHKYSLMELSVCAIAY